MAETKFLKAKALKTLKTEANGARGLILTIDGLLSLVLVVASFAVFAAFTQNLASSESNIYNSVSSIGRDYLVLKYLKNKDVGGEDFRNLTGMNASETIPSGNLVLRSNAFVYPKICGCSSTPCSLNKTSGLGGGASTCLTNQTPLAASRKEVWITPK